ncbi:HAD-IA family hydrolase [Photobacterium carnosum]|uniref:HAD-IA family hydrolase n=1 Tax=Photobacterium carnosum TaxID=2023717 RepID=UPI001E3442F6|nr:HAD-IA family hydrolase [Photobacterium carnosum]MCD9496909.1 HAD-IA family hydrolase [Photobacterium carnosum]MCD9517014.1 HAD-IA family hydrolase [Photobacterium carnosum]
MNTITVRGFIFDVDATLVDTISVIDKIWKEWSAVKQLNFSDVRPFVHGRKINETLAEVNPNFDTEDGVLEVKRIAIEKMKEAKAIPGALTFVNQIPNGMWSIATSGPRQVAETSLKASGFLLPDVMICGEDVTYGKPHPEPFLAAAKQLHLLPQQCVAFEDSPVGIRSAHEAGCFTIALTTSHERHELKEADVIIDDFADINLIFTKDKEIKLIFKNG